MMIFQDHFGPANDEPTIRSVESSTLNGTARTEQRSSLFSQLTFNSCFVVKPVPGDDGG